MKNFCLMMALLALVSWSASCGGAKPTTKGPDETIAGETAASEAGAQEVSAEAKARSQAEMMQAIGLLGSGDAKGALPLLGKATESDPGNHDAWLLLGKVQRGGGQLDQALDSFRRVLELPRGASTAMYEIGLTHAIKGEREQALSWLTKARATGKVDTTQVANHPAGAKLADDPRFAELFPSATEFSDSFVERVQVIRQWQGEAPGDQFGWIARTIGDVDGDGIADMVTSAPTHKRGEKAAGKVYVYSGKTGALVWSQLGPDGSELGTGLEAAGDVDGDGVPDVVAGGPKTDQAFVYSGKDGSVLWPLAPAAKGVGFGTAATGIGDIDNDGHADVAIGAPKDDQGAVHVYSGKTGRILATLRGEAAGDKFGSAIDGVARGGVALLVIGAPDAGLGKRGRVYVYRALDQRPAFTIESDEQGFELGGMFVSVIGDIDSDGVPDVYGSDWAHAALGSYTGRIHVHSGASGRRLLTLTGEAKGDAFGIGPADAGDVDGDGHADLIVGAWQHRKLAPAGGKVYLYSGKDGTLMHTYTGKVMGEAFGFDATGMGDVDGDGVIDFLLTSAWSAIAGTRSGRVYVVSGARPAAR